MVAVVDGCVGTIDGCSVAAARARLQHVDDAAEHPPVVNPARTAPSQRQKRLNSRPLRIAQPTKMLPIKAPSVQSLEAHLDADRNPIEDRP